MRVCMCTISSLSLQTKLVPVGACDVIVQCLAESAIGSEVYQLALIALGNLATPEVLTRALERAKSSLADVNKNAAVCRANLVVLSALASAKSLEKQLEQQRVQTEMLEHAQ